MDCVADVAGGEILATALPCVRDGGRWGIAGAIAGPVVQFDLRRLYLKNIRLIGSSMHTREHFTVLAALARRGDLSPVIDRVLELDAIAEAQKHFATGDRTGKIVLTPGSS